MPTKQDFYNAIMQLVTEKRVYAILDGDGVMQFVSAVHTNKAMRDAALTPNDVRRLFISGEASPDMPTRW